MVGYVGANGDGPGFFFGYYVNRYFGVGDAAVIMTSECPPQTPHLADNQFPLRNLDQLYFSPEAKAARAQGFIVP